MAKPDSRNTTEQAFLDAAERLLVEVGYANITTRRLAEEAGANLGLVHYYFGSMEQLFIRVLERFTDRLIERQRAMYAAPLPFIEKWRAAMGYLDEDRESGYQKIWLELQALAWNRPELRERLVHVRRQWVATLIEAFGPAMEEYGLDTERFPIAAMVALVATFNEGIILDRLGGITEGHAELLAMIENWLVSLEERKQERKQERASRKRTKERGTIMRARTPDQAGSVERDGVKIAYEVFGSGETTILLLPTWSIIHSRFWKMQVPYLARHYRVVTFDGRGNGTSDRPTDPAAYAKEEVVADALAVLDATETPRAALVTLSMSAQWGLLLAANHPERVAGVVFIAPALPIATAHGYRMIHSFDDVLDTDEGWAKYNRHYWLRDYQGFLEFFFSQCFTEPHSTKQIEDSVGWGLETTPQTLLAIEDTPSRKALYDPSADTDWVQASAARVRCPTLVIHGDQDAISPHRRGVALAEATGGTLVTLEGGGHIPNARDPVKVNLLLNDFMRRLEPAPTKSLTWTRGHSRKKRALYISSPIGLGHAQRDVAIAAELRKLHPDLEIDWLAQHPVTRVLEARGERIHPASAFLANESSHVESESAEHDLHVFQALRRMDEILIANYMLFHDVVTQTQYDLWIGDEAWELDYYLHENPEEKRAAYVWMTDFVGYLPMPDGGERESFLTADYNAEMIEQVERYRRIRDRAVFVGNPDDIVPDTFGGDLPPIRDWTEAHYDFAGYVTGFDPASFADREAIRAELGYRPDERVCIVAVGGSGVGYHLLRRVMEAFPEAKRRVPDLRMIVVAGPRIDPASLPVVEGLEVRPFVYQLYRHLAVCDLAVVQGGLTTAMELTANQRPFLYFPLRHHFEQNFHVRHRLNRYGAGRCMDYETATPETIAEAIAQEIDRPVTYRDVETDGAARAAALIAELL